MKRKLKDFTFGVITCVLLLFGSIYYINYEVEGDIGFVTAEEATIYKAPRLSSDKIDTVHFGDDITILKTGLSRYKSFVKVRLDYPDKRSKVGYVSENKIEHYEFPNIDNTDDNYLIFCDEDISLEEFIPEFKKTIAEKNTIGVYFKRDVLEEQNRSDLEQFLSTQHIPWGMVSVLDKHSVETFEEVMVLENSLLPSEIFEDFNVLPVVFELGYSDSSPLIEHINIPFLILASNPDVNAKGVPVWIDSTSNSSELATSVDQESIYAYTFEKESTFSLVRTSARWAHEIRDAYETAREEAAE